MMQQVEIFKTNINNKRNALHALQNLSLALPEYDFNFDLDDCDKVLRVAGHSIDIGTVLNSMKRLGYQCEQIH